MKRNRRTIWLILCAACVGLVLLKPDGGILMFVPLLLLTFPAGVIGYVAFIGLCSLVPSTWGWDVGDSLLAKFCYIVTLWSLMVFCGYLQWFVLIRWIGRRWDRLASRGNQPIKGDER